MTPKSYVLSPRPLSLMMLLALYLVGALFWIPALKQKPDLAVTGTLWSVMTLLMTVVIGVFMFAETLAPHQIVGVVFAVGAVVLLSV